MNPLAVTIDPSVWVSAADATDKFYTESRALLAHLAGSGGWVYVPAFACVEVACALSRRRRDAAAGRLLAKTGMLAAGAVDVAADDSLLDEAMEHETENFLRGAVALFAAAAVLTGSALISWDDEHITRAGGISPSAWLASLPASAP